MSKVKSLNLGQGIRRGVKYDSLRKMLRDHRVGMSEARSVLNKYFPNELKREIEEIRERRVVYARAFEARRWGRYIAEAGSVESMVPYRYSHEYLMREAASSHSKPRKGQTQNRVTDFTGWIYDLYRPARCAAALSNGKRGERDVAIIKREASLANAPTNWTLLYADPLEEKPEALKISLLDINGKSMAGAPDYIFFNEVEKTILIVEIKVTNKDIPSDGWPNLRAQLWAYAHCDKIMNMRNANRVVLIGEIWANDAQLRRVLKWELSDTVFYEQNLELFLAYQAWSKS